MGGKPSVEEGAGRERPPPPPGLEVGGAATDSHDAEYSQEKAGGAGGDRASDGASRPTGFNLTSGSCSASCDDVGGVEGNAQGAGNADERPPQCSAAVAASVTEVPGPLEGVAEAVSDGGAGSEESNEARPDGFGGGGDGGDSEDGIEDPCDKEEEASGVGRKKEKQGTEKATEEEEGDEEEAEGDEVAKSGEHCSSTAAEGGAEPVAAESEGDGQVDLPPGARQNDHDREPRLPAEGAEGEEEGDEAVGAKTEPAGTDEVGNYGDVPAVPAEAEGDAPGRRGHADAEFPPLQQADLEASEGSEASAPAEGQAKETADASSAVAAESCVGGQADQPAAAGDEGGATAQDVGDAIAEELAVVGDGGAAAAAAGPGEGPESEEDEAGGTAAGQSIGVGESAGAGKVGDDDAAAIPAVEEDDAIGAQGDADVGGSTLRQADSKANEEYSAPAVGQAEETPDASAAVAANGAGSGEAEKPTAAGDGGAASAQDAGGPVDAAAGESTGVADDEDGARVSAVKAGAEPEEGDEVSGATAGDGSGAGETGGAGKSGDDSTTTALAVEEDDAGGPRGDTDVGGPPLEQADSKASDGGEISGLTVGEAKKTTCDSLAVAKDADARGVADQPPAASDEGAAAAANEGNAKDAEAGEEAYVGDIVPEAAAAATGTGAQPRDGDDEADDATAGGGSGAGGSAGAGVGDGDPATAPAGAGGDAGGPLRFINAGLRSLHIAGSEPKEGSEVAIITAREPWERSEDVSAAVDDDESVKAGRPTASSDGGGAIAPHEGDVMIAGVEQAATVQAAAGETETNEADDEANGATASEPAGAGEIGDDDSLAVPAVAEGGTGGWRGDVDRGGPSLHQADSEANEGSDFFVAAVEEARKTMNVSSAAAADDHWCGETDRPSAASDGEGGVAPDDDVDIAGAGEAAVVGQDQVQNGAAAANATNANSGEADEVSESEDGPEIAATAPTASGPARAPPAAPHPAPLARVVAAATAAAAAAAASRTADEALGIAVRSGFVPPADLLGGVTASHGACRAYRDGRTFHVRVTADTPKHVWSPPSPPPPPVGAGGGFGDGGPASRTPARGRTWGGVAPLRVSHITWDRADEDLGEDFALELPLDLEKLTLGFSFNRPVDGVDVDWPPGMKALHFGMAFDPRSGSAANSRSSSPLPGPAPPPASALSSSGGGGSGAPVAPAAPAGPAAAEVEPTAVGGAGPGWAKFLAPTLEEIVFGGHFNQPVSEVKWPPGLKRLVFGANFKQDIEAADWPDSLEELTFGAYFNQDVEGAKWPKSLRKLVFGTGFNSPIEKCRFPEGLEEIVFGTHFNQPIAGVTWPCSLRQVTFGDRFNQPVISSSWPPSSLTHLTFGRAFDQPLVSPPASAPLPHNGGESSGGEWPPGGLKLVIVGSKYSGDVAEPGGVRDSVRDHSRSGGGVAGERFAVVRRVSPRRAKRRGSKASGDVSGGSSGARSSVAARDSSAGRRGLRKGGNGSSGKNSSATSESTLPPPKTLSPLAVQWRKKQTRAPSG